MTREKPRPKWTPRLAKFLPSLRRTEEDINQNIFMFVEDISNPMPLHRTKKMGLSVQLSGTEDAQRRALQVLDDLSERSGHSAEDKLANAVDSLAKGIAWEGRVQFELIPRDDGTTFFHQFTTKRSLRIFGVVVQYLSLDDRQFWQSPALRWAPVSTMWHIDVPKELGGRRGHKCLLLGLRKFNNLGPRFLSTDMQSGGNPSNFDISAYVRSNNIFRFKLAHAWGWNCRDLSTDRTTEFYNMYRSAAAEKSQSILRSHIIAQINSLLKRLKIDCTISAEGLLTTEAAERMMHELVSGQLSFKEFLDIKYGTRT
ncbi:hypothetical protein [Paraburkholderia lycopersici]|uniref:Uncharacterized protein n=1 Tax=Paraburkholderia lycopersici TaxID=416944 RepID=A0A1G6LVI7_9BURK|nr:hypothetical protein [Paraburkholderia lycopersici]SDC47097.1 hypothetical protein SAMN05421548_10750 [Paraburkholderia lycopersici]